jgi:hypothetical protein
MPSNLRRTGWALVAGLAVALAAGCAARRPPAPAPPAPPSPAESAAARVDASAGEPPAALDPLEPAGGREPGGGATAPAAPSAGEPAGLLVGEPGGPPEAPGQPARLRDLCRQEPSGEAVLGATRRRLEQTFCSATLWFDGLLGGVPDVENAKAVSGRIELSNLYTEVDGNDPKARLRVRYDLPNLERRVNLFLGRDDEEEFVEDRREGAAIRSSVFGLDTEDEWLAGLGYAPPGRWAAKLDFRVGGRVKTSPEVFVQARYRRNAFIGEHMVWRLRETLFWDNRENFGATTSLDLDRVLTPNLVLRWGNVGTFSEATEGLAWRSAVVAYHHLGNARALAGEAFWRGSTDAEILVREYGARGIYRQPLGDRYLFGELIVGYTWPRFERDEPREGSATVGLGIEFLFGREPY